MMSLLKLFNYLNILTPQVSVYLRTLSFDSSTTSEFIYFTGEFEVRNFNTILSKPLFRKVQNMNYYIPFWVFGPWWSLNFKYSYFDVHLSFDSSTSSESIYFTGEFEIRSFSSSKLSISRFRHPTSAFSKMESLKYELLHSTWVVVFGIRTMMPGLFQF